ncbi:MAG: folate-binding protein [Burkholderiaceae bacterium]|nr:folate-binding protein [Burkholderiaceae bacterium]
MSLPVLSSLSVALPHWGVIRAVGADAVQLLHSQLTQDVQSLGPHQARLAGYCSPKGRLLASFVIWKPGDDEVLMACHASVLPATLKRLSMFVLRAKCKLSDASAEVALTGVSGSAAQAATQDLPTWGLRADEHGTWIRLPGVAGIARAWRITGTAASRPADPSALAGWQRLEVDSGIVTIEAATVDQFVPQMLNFELIGAVNFQKGCYPGQEVVARSQYRGTTKRRTLLFAAEAPVSAGLEVFHSADPTQPAGRVACAAPAPDAAAPLAHHALIEVKLAALEGGSLHLGAPDGTVLTRCPMPYEVLNAETA